MQTKPWFCSRTIVATLVAALVSFLNLFHVNLHDLVPMITDTLGQVVNAAIALIVMYHAIKGRIDADRVLVGTQDQADVATSLLVAARNKAANLSQALTAPASASASASSTAAAKPLTDLQTK
jgi:hypothetical protein